MMELLLSGPCLNLRSFGPCTGEIFPDGVGSALSSSSFWSACYSTGFCLLCSWMLIGCYLYVIKLMLSAKSFTDGLLCGVIGQLLRNMKYPD